MNENPNENENENEAVDVDQAWEHNRRQVDKWLKGVQEIVTEAGGEDRTKGEIAAALEMGFMVRLSSSLDELSKVPAMLSILATMYLYGDGPEIPDDELPPMITTDDN